MGRNKREFTEVLNTVQDLLNMCQKNCQEYHILLERRRGASPAQTSRQQLTDCNTETSNLAADLSRLLSRLRRAYKTHEMLLQQARPLGLATHQVAWPGLQRCQELCRRHLTQVHKIPRLTKYYAEEPGQQLNESHKLLNYFAEWSQIQTRFMLLVCLSDRNSTPNRTKHTGQQMEELEKMKKQLSTILESVLTSLNPARKEAEKEQAAKQERSVWLCAWRERRTELVQAILETRARLQQMSTENDCLIGALVRLNPNFIHSQEFRQLQTPVTTQTKRFSNQCNGDTAENDVSDNASSIQNHQDLHDQFD